MSQKEPPNRERRVALFFTLRELGIPVEYTQHEVGPSQHEIPRQGVRRRSAAARPRAVGALRPVGELLQTAGLAVRGARLHRVVPAQPLRVDPGAGLPPWPGARDTAEIRCTDPSCNPYLTFAALLHAGLEGIEKRYELPEPIERNL
jgi:glutamine synthetase